MRITARRRCNRKLVYGMKKILRAMSDERGSAMVSVFLVITVLLVLGMGILALSLSNTKQAVTTNTYERCFYAADSGAKQGVERLKSAALEYYRVVAEEVKAGSMANNNAASFFAYLDAIGYTAPQPDAASGGPTSLGVSISNTAVDADTHRYTVLATASGDSATRKVAGTIDITFEPITTTSGFTSFGDQAIIAGGTFTMGTKINVPVNGDVRFGAYVNPRSNPPTYSKYDGLSANNENVPGWIDPATADSLNWDLNYSSFVLPKTAVTPSLPLIKNGDTVNTSYIASKGATLTSPFYIEGEPGASYSIKALNINRGQFISDGNLTIDGGSGYFGTSSSYLKIYVKGNLVIKSTTLSYAKIFCEGNVTIDGSGDFTGVEIYCKGDVKISSINLVNVKVYSGDQFTFGGGNVTGQSLVYAKNDMKLGTEVGGGSSGCTLSGLFYSNGTASVNAGGSMTGQIVAKGNMTMAGSFSFTYNQALIDAILDDPNFQNGPFVTGNTSGSSTQVVEPASSKIFTATSPFTER